MTVMLRPNSMIVVPSWINTISELRPGISATELPEDNSTWGASGFVVVSVIGGSRDIYINAGRPVVRLEVYAGVANKSRPLWGTANNVYQAIVAAHETPSTIQRQLTLSVRGKSYGKARVMSCYPLGEEQKKYDVDGDYACIWANWQFHWVTEN